MFPSIVLLSLATVATASPLSDFSRLSSLFPRSTGCAALVPTCQNTTVQADLCCFEYPGGQLLQTQIWDTLGPSNAWTIHGLWPNNCDGTYRQSCDSTRVYPSATYASISALMTGNGRTDLLNFMNQYWLDENGNNESFWQHEWNKHGTCMSTLRPSCFPAGSTTGTDAITYFDKAVSLYKGLSTYTFLSAAGIVPSSSARYTLAQLQSAVRAKWGFTPAFDCTGGALSAVSYYHNLKGSAIDGVWMAVDAQKPGTCPATGISYPPKPGTPMTTTSTSTASPTSTSVSAPPKSTITVRQASGTITGGLLSYGTWSTQTPGTMTATTSGTGFTLTSSKGKCAVSSTGLTCASTVSSATVFTAVSSGGKTLLAYQGSTAFTADSVPSGTTQITLYSGSARAQDVTLVMNAV